MQDVAVVISVYDGDDPENLRLALESIFNQSYSEGCINVYLVCDGPLDELLLNVVEDFSKSIKKLIKLKRNGGLANALNEGIRSVGEEEVVIRMDADDICDHERFLTQVSFLNNNPEVSVVGSNVILINQDGCELKEVFFPERHGDILRAFSVKSPLAHPAVCMRREVIDSVGLYNERLRKAQDLEYWFRVAEKGFRFHNIQEPLLFYRVSDGFGRKKNGLSSSFRLLKINVLGHWRVFGLRANYFMIFSRAIFRLLPSSLYSYIYRRYR
ncbi:glycosyltransferase [Halomonas mongoliensis]|uniref:glycosyltransferase n=1 Tax=Halomonas mongoliensis TaxID=321265 RepID=UPI00403AF5AA